jgi:hypothetical protein
MMQVRIMRSAGVMTRMHVSTPRICQGFAGGEAYRID